MMKSSCGQPPPHQPRADGIDGNRAVVQAGLEQAAQTLFSAAGTKLADAEELRAAVSGAAVKAVLEARIEQIVKHGHSAENDDTLPLGWLPKEARETLSAASDNLWGPKRDLAVARRRFVRAGAFVLAAIDRLDRELAAIGKGEGQ